MTQGFGGFLPPLGDGGDEVKVLAVWQLVVLGVRFFLVFFANHDENQNIKLNENTLSTLSFCRKSL